MNEKIRKLSEIWCQWNRNQIRGDAFALAFYEVFKQETMQIWRQEEEKISLKHLGRRGKEPVNKKALAQADKKEENRG